MSYHANPTIQLSVGADKDSPAKRSKRGLMITTAAQKSMVCQTHADARAAADEVTKETVTLDAAVAAYDLADAAYKKARTALTSAVLAWDGSFDVYVALGEKYCASADSSRNTTASSGRSASTSTEPQACARWTSSGAPPPTTRRRGRDWKATALST
jgi:hypothetical protein